MNRIHRDGMNVGVMMSVRAKRLLNRALLAQPMPVRASPQSDALPADAFAPSVPLASGNVLKRILRPIARFIFRAIKPLVRPFAFRIRWYLVETLRTELLHEVRLSTAMTRQQIQMAAESLRADMQELHDAHALSLQEMRTSAESRDALHDLEAHLNTRLDRIESYAYGSARRAALYCGDNEVLIRTGAGYVLCSAHDHLLLAMLLDSGEIELGTRLLIGRLLRPGDVFVDVGANIGMHTLAAGNALQGRGRIFAFEPYEPTKRLLEKSVWMNGLAEITQIHRAAVSNRSGSHPLFLGAASGHHSLFSLVGAGEPSAAPPIEVPLVRLDEIIASDQTVTLLKIDVEGAELEVLESAAAIIDANPDIALIVEFGPSHLRRIGHSTGQWFAAFEGLGLRHRVIDALTGRLEDWSLDQLEGNESANLLFAREHSTAWARATT